MFTKLFHNYKEIILYVFFGGCTTLVNLAAYFIFTRFFNISIMVSTLIAWWFAVIFAYITNRKLVFRSENTSIKAIMLEFAFFVACRLLTGFADMGIMYLFVDQFGWYDLMMKIISNIIVILGNYIASTLFIFKKRQ